MKSIKLNSLILTAVLLLSACATQQPISQVAVEKKAPEASWVNTDTVKAGRFDTGRMWTFDFPPTDYFKEAYGFSPDEKWFEKVRMSALRIPGCTASFVSGDGLVMTNHHCARGYLTRSNREGENLPEDGFWAPTLEDERKVENVYADQLILIEDVTSVIQTAMDAGTTDEEKQQLRDAKIEELTNNYKTETGYEIQVKSFYNGGRYSLYGYKRYTDLRLVFAPEHQLGFFGGDPDNFTYPRYNLDCTFLRVYDDNGQPLKTDNFFKWSDKGAAKGEPVFVVGNPGTTTRLYTVSQLEYQRDVQYPYTMEFLNGLVKLYGELIAEYPERKMELNDLYFGLANSQKAYGGILKGLRDPVLMAKKRDFEKQFKADVIKSAENAATYGELWDKIAKTRIESKKLFSENVVLNPNPRWTSEYLAIPVKLARYASEMKKPEAERMDRYKGEALEQTKSNILPNRFDEARDKKLLVLNIELMDFLLDDAHLLMKTLKGMKSSKQTAEMILSEYNYMDKDKIDNLLQQGPDAILALNDPLMTYAKMVVEKGNAISEKYNKLNAESNAHLEKLGRALYAAYGTSFPPDATFSLRISDGIVKGFEYNGTVAPPITTFYGMYDRFHSFSQEFPWDLPERWLEPGSDFDMETPFNFVSTADIIGGNSGSAVINRNAEVVGLAFDGNIESLPGQFIFDETLNRTVAVHSSGMLEAIQDLYLYKRLSEELRTGKLQPAK